MHDQLTPALVDPAHAERVTALAAAARVAAIAHGPAALRDALAAVTAATFELHDDYATLVTAWLTPDGQPEARTWVFAQHLLLVTGVLAVGAHRSQGLPLRAFPTIVIHPVPGPYGAAQRAAAAAVSAFVRGDLAGVALVLAAHLDPQAEPADPVTFLDAAGAVARTCALRDSAHLGCTVEHVLTTLSVTCLTALT